jgi:hypothetical protein
MQMIDFVFPSPNFPPWSVAIPNVDKKFVRIAFSGASSRFTNKYKHKHVRESDCTLIQLKFY